MFPTIGNLQHLGRAETWYGGGTFSVCSSLSYQLYTIHAEVHDQIVPLVFTLLPSKSKRCYLFMCLELRNPMLEKGTKTTPKSCRSDLETVPSEAILSVFTPENVSICFFHLAQAHWRKIQNLGLMELYISNEQYSLLFRSFTALAFVPEDKVVEFFKHLSDSVPQNAPIGVHEFIDNIAETYVGHEVYERAKNQGEGLNGQAQEGTKMEGSKVFPKTVVCLWKVLNDEPRTTNKLEGWHRRFSTVVAKHHPYLYDFISCLRAEQARSETVISKIFMCEVPEATRKMERSKNERIKKAEQFQQREMDEYLRDLPYNIKYNVTLT